MNWLDTQTKELLQKVADEKLAPPKASEFALILLHKGPAHQRLIQAIQQINECSERDALALAARSTPITIDPDLTEEEALWGQFELICSDAISIFLRSEVMGHNDQSYLRPLYKKIMESDEFKPTMVNLTEVPKSEQGQKFIEQFLGHSQPGQTFPLKLTVRFKKARIMEHWAARVGAQLEVTIPENRS